MTELQAIRERCEKATPGPWRHNSYFGYDQRHMTGHWLERVSGQHATMLFMFNGVVKYEDMNFVAHARTDIPAILAEVERLRNGAKFEAAKLKATEDMVREYNQKMAVMESLLDPDRLRRLLMEHPEIPYDEKLGDGSNPDYIGPHGIDNIVQAITSSPR